MTLTIITSAATAFFSTVVLQYFFGPWLEARKSRLLEHGEAAAAFSDRLRAMEGILFTLVNYSDQDKAAYVRARGQLRHDLHAMDLTSDFQRLRIRPDKYRNHAGATIALADHILACYLPQDKYLNTARKRVLIAADMIDPATAPWSRAYSALKMKRLVRSMRSDYRMAESRILAREAADGGLSL